MLFNSLVFVIFCFLFFLLLPLINKSSNNIRWSFFVFASFVFYGWWNWLFLFLIIGSGLIDYFAALGIKKWPKYATLIFIISLFGNIGSLIAFKYSKFLAENIELLCSVFGFQLGLKSTISDFFYILPVGISFYTFQSMSYTIDVYRGRLIPTKNVLHFFSYLSLFPQLVAGPIVRARDFLPQLLVVRKTKEIERWNGAKLIAIGFFKKVVMADTLAPFVNNAFSNIAPSNSSIYWWIVMTAFAFQIYFDFSGYSDIARGLAKWMGMHFRINFNHPYISTSIREFWTRWHISLSTWFRDYVYIPLGGSHKGKFRSHLNMWFTMTISGLWHGASFNFIIWGALHAAYLSAERITKWSYWIKKIFLGKIFAWIIVFIEVLLAWVFFRAQDFNQALSIIIKMLRFNLNLEFNNDDIFKNAMIILLIGMSIECFFLLKFNRRVHHSSSVYKIFEIIYIAILICCSIFLAGSGMQFIYFQF